MVAESRARFRAVLGGRPGQRADLTGLRALAVVPLLLAAAGLGIVPGGFVGIDILFVLCGFLVTGSLTAEWNRTGQISLLGFYARRARELLPAAALVLGAALVLTLVCLPRDRWAATGWDLVASGLLVQNWRLAEQGVEALTPDAGASILAHYWALGVAGQLILLWPVLLVGVATWAVRRGGPDATARSAHRPLLITVGLLAVGSFAWSVQRTAEESEGAFFGTGTRLWELALGAALALLGTRLAGLPRRLGTVLGWTGLAGVGVAVLTLRPGPEFPGYLALLPTLGTAAIIVAGMTAGPSTKGPHSAGPRSTGQLNTGQLSTGARAGQLGTGLRAGQLGTGPRAGQLGTGPRGGRPAASGSSSGPKGGPATSDGSTGSGSTINGSTGCGPSPNGSTDGGRPVGGTSTGAIPAGGASVGVVPIGAASAATPVGGTGTPVTPLGRARVTGPTVQGHLGDDGRDAERRDAERRDTETGYPGTAETGPARILATRPMRAVGGLCYPLYLWHWPLLVAAHAWFGELGPVAGLAVLGCAALLAFVTSRYVEAPLRAGIPAGWSPGQLLRAGALIPAVAVIAGLLFQLTVWPPTQSAPPPAAAPAPAAAGPTPASAPAPGAAALGRSPLQSPAGVPVDQVRSITPAPGDAAADLPDVYRHNCFPEFSSGSAKACVYGDRESRFTVALVGDSHAASWVPALQTIAAAKRWRLITYLKPSCPFLKLQVATEEGRTMTACTQWYDNVVAELTRAERPDLLVTTSFRYFPGRNGRALTGPEAHEALVQGMRRTWSELTSLRLPTVVLRDLPIHQNDSATCVSANPKRLTRCATPRHVALAVNAGAAQAEAVEQLDGVTLIDLNSAICPAERCAPVIGGVLVYRDSQHLTATYARTLAPRLRTALERVLRADP